MSQKLQDKFITKVSDCFPEGNDDIYQALDIYADGYYDPSRECVELYLDNFSVYKPDDQILSYLLCLQKIHRYPSDEWQKLSQHNVAFIQQCISLSEKSGRDNVELSDFSQSAIDAVQIKNYQIASQVCTLDKYKKENLEMSSFVVVMLDRITNLGESSSATFNLMLENIQDNLLDIMSNYMKQNPANRLSPE